MPVHVGARSGRGEPWLRDGDARNAQSRWRDAVEAFQTRMRTMVDHPDYGRADPTCARCGGAGRYQTRAPSHLDSAGYCALPWAKVLRRPCTTPRSWPIGWQLGVAFAQKLGVETFAPTPTQDEAIDPRHLPVAPRVPVTVALLLERGLIPDVAAIVDRSGAWHEREEVEIAEDLASWHARIQALLRASPDASVSVLEAR